MSGCVRSRQAAGIAAKFLAVMLALNLLGLNWRLKPTNGHLVSTGLSTGIPSTGDVATVPSGGRGRNEKRKRV
ncbi:teneurin-2 isoform X1 [Tachysurus ichikawai]